MGGRAYRNRNPLNTFSGVYDTYGIYGGEGNLVTGPWKITEKQWQADVVEIAQLFGWHAYHTFDSRRSTPGFPDLILVRPPVLIAVELKTDKGRITPTQQAWLDELAHCTEIRTHLWRPADRDQVLDQLCPDTIRIHVDNHPGPA
jgi:hypothetical protein